MAAADFWSNRERAQVDVTTVRSPTPCARTDAASSVAKAKYGERYYSLFVEAAAP